jgi:hypothetical protein
MKMEILKVKEIIKMVCYKDQAINISLVMK